MKSVLERLRAALAPGIAVEREFARGGMGILFLGRDTVLERPVAIKVLKPELATALASERFLREARHAAGLQHPNVVRVHRTGEANGLLFYIMDYMAGDTLAARLARGRLPAREVVRLGLDLLAALGAAHRQKLIHRDVKPSNIFLSRGRALLGDFGVAYAFDTTSTALTQPGHPVGTLAYISPEQLQELPVTECTDLYAVGLVLYEAASGRRWKPVTEPARGDWSTLPRFLRDPIRRALEVEPGDRWPDADSFAGALASAERGARLKLVAGSAVAIALAALLLAMYAPCTLRPWTCSRPSLPVHDLAVFPFTTVSLGDSILGWRLAAQTGWSLQVQGLTLASRQTAIRAWRGSRLPPPQRLVALTGEATRSRYGVWALVRPRGAHLEIQLRVVGANGRPVLEGTVSGPADDPAALGDSVAGILARAIQLPRGATRRQEEVTSRATPEAVEQFLLGEEAFARDAWLTAERHYLRAFQLDSTFVLAAWRLGNTRRWLPLRPDPPYPPGFYGLFQRNRDAVPPVDRHLIEAQFRSSGQPRFEEYERAMLVAGDDPYAPLLYGDELFHRGPLAGRPLADAVSMLAAAVETDSTLAPGWEHLAWALTRLGDARAAGAALSQLERWADPAGSEIHVPTFLRMAYTFRFGDTSAQSKVAEALARSPEALALAARGALSFDLPGAQVRLAGALAASGDTPAERASGQVGRGVALVALGRPTEAQQAFDSAATLFPDAGEARLQAAEWRVIPAALGAEGWSEADRERGRVALRSLTEDPAASARASWALALDAHARGDAGEARRGRERVGTSSRHGALGMLLAGLEEAARGDWQAALAVTEPALAFDSAGHAPDPFLRSALHWKRGEWLERSGRTAEADRSWLWYENLDLRGWPAAEAQPAEVDWALASYARVRRARLALQHGRTAEGCAHLRRVTETWAGAEPAVAAVSRELSAEIRTCAP